MSERIGRVLEPLLDRMGYLRRLRKGLAVSAWPRVAGPKVAAHATAREVRGDVLVVCVPSPAWAQELTFLKPRLLHELARILGDDAPTGIRFETAARGAGSGSDPERPPPRGPAGRIEPGPEHLRRARVDAGVVPDERLRRAFEIFQARCRAARQLERKEGWKGCPICGVPHPDGPSLCPACRRTQGQGRQTRST